MQPNGTRMQRELRKSEAVAQFLNARHERYGELFGNRESRPDPDLRGSAAHMTKDQKAEAVGAFDQETHRLLGQLQDRPAADFVFDGEAVAHGAIK